MTPPRPNPRPSPRPASHFDGLVFRACASLSPSLEPRWGGAWSKWTPGDAPPHAPWLGPPPSSFGLAQLDPDRLPPSWAAFCSALALGRSAQPQPALAWLGAFWISLCMSPDPESHAQSHPLAQARLAELSRAIHHFSLRLHADAHHALLDFARPLAWGLAMARDPGRALLLLKRDGLDALGRAQSVAGWSAACGASLADRTLAELLAPFLHGRHDAARRPILLSRLPNAARALLGAGATAAGVAACLLDRACIAWLSLNSPASSAPDDNRPWRAACSAAFGPAMPLFSQELRSLGAPRASEALGPTIDELERLELLDCAPSPRSGAARGEPRL